MNDWKIDKVRRQCAECAAEFTDDQRVISVVELDPEDVPVRRDFCARCYSGRQACPIFWETRFEAPVASRRKIDFNRLLRLFEGWVENPPPGQGPLLYLIALLLVRKRFFKLLDLATGEDGAEYLRLKRPGRDGERFGVLAPLLAPRELPALRLQLEQLIDGSVDEGEVEDATLPGDSRSGE